MPGAVRCRGPTLHVVKHVGLIGLWIASALAACLTPTATTCDDGSLCGAGQVCRPNGGGCVDPAQVDACDGRADGDTCG